MGASSAPVAEARRAVAPLLLLAVGNPSRGDDALGPALLERLGAAGVGRDGEVELMLEFQLQVEHALDLEGRRAVLFVDAARPGLAQGAALGTVEAGAPPLPASHALAPEALLGVATRLGIALAPAWLLAIEGESFALGDGLSAVAARNLERAEGLALEWIASRRADR